MSYTNNFALGADGDLTNSRPVLQLRVAQNAILDADGDSARANPKDATLFAVPYPGDVKRSTMGCISGEVALKRRRTGKKVTEHNIYSGPTDPKLPAGTVPHFSYLNQLSVTMPQDNFNLLSTEEQRCMIENEFQVAGIVGTTAEPEYEGKQLGKNIFVVEIGGVRSIINNNPTKTILQGQLVLARAPLLDSLPKAPQGTDPKKVLVVLEPFDPNSVVTRDTIEHFLRVGDAAAGPTADEEKRFMDKFVNFPKGTGMDVPEAKTHPVHFMRAFVAFIGSIKGLAPVSLRSVRTILINGTTVTPEVMDLMNSFHVVNHHVQSHVLGVALSDGPPNTRFDIKFGSYAL